MNGTYLRGFPYAGIQQEGIFFRRKPARNRRLEALKRFRLGGDYFLWTQLAKSSELHSVLSFLGAFRVHKGQLSEGLAAYQKEARNCTRAETFREKVTRYWEYHSPPWLRGVLWNFTLGQSPRASFASMRQDRDGWRDDDVPVFLRTIRENFLSAEQLMRACGQVWSADSRADISIERGQPLAGSCVYGKVDHLVGLFDQVRQVRNRVVLVSSESDRPITKEFLQRCPPQIAHWFSTNIETKDERLSALPLGLANSYCGITLKAPLIAAHSRPFGNVRAGFTLTFEWRAIQPSASQ